MRNFAAFLLASTVFASSVFAADSGSGASLAPGKPAGVKEAQMGGNGFLMIAGIVIVAGGIALVTSEGNSGGNIAVTTTTTAVP